jgi:mono/diheme cytochrome c family protein
MRRTRRLVLLTSMAACLLVHGPAHGDVAAGKQSFDGLCANCHGPRGQGDGPAGIDILPSPRDFTVGEFKFDADSDGEPGTDADLVLVIRNGASVYGGNPLMAPWGQLSEGQIRDLVAYVRSLAESPANETAGR